MKKVIGCLTGCLIGFILLIFTFVILPFGLITFGVVGPISSFLINTRDKAIETVKDITEEIGVEVGSAISEILHEYDLTHGLYGDLAPMNPDITECEECSSGNCECEVIDYYFDRENNTRKQPTLRLNKGEGEGPESYKNMDWQYTGWTIDNSSYWDVDYSKFSKKEVDDPSERLFQWKINNYASMAGTGKQTFTFESRAYFEGNPIELDESTRNGSFCKTNSGAQWLDLGDIRFSTFDSRIESAFAPMVVSTKLDYLFKAKGWFHRGDIWTGVEQSFQAPFQVWHNPVPRGTFIDVVFEENESGKQVVIPFIYSDAKNVHWFDSVGQRVDQRYGQCRADVKNIGINGTYTREENVWVYEMIKLCDSVDYFQQAYIDTGKYNRLTDILTIKNHQITTQYSEADMTVGHQFILNASDGYFTKVGFKLADNTVGILKFTGMTKVPVVGNQPSDDDILTYKAHTALELIKLYYNAKYKGVQDMNYYICQALLEGFTLGNEIRNRNPNWSLICMRVYPDAHEELKDTEAHMFTDLSKEFETTEEIDAQNKVIEFNCAEDCTCTICQHIAER